MQNIYYKDEQKQVDFIVKLAQINKTSKVLDLGHYRGNHLAQIQKLTPFAFGFDKHSKCGLPNTKNDFDFFREDWDLQELDCIYCLSPEFGADWARVELLFGKISEALKTGGLFVFDHFNYNSIVVGTTWKDYRLTDDFVGLSIFSRKPTEMICNRTNIDKDWNKSETEISWRIFSEAEITQKMQDLGMKKYGFYLEFDVENKIKNWDQIPPKTRLISVWQKI